MIIRAVAMEITTEVVILTFKLGALVSVLMRAMTMMRVRAGRTFQTDNLVWDPTTASFARILLA